MYGANITVATPYLHMANVRLDIPAGIIKYKCHLYIADYGNNAIRKVAYDN